MSRGSFLALFVAIVAVLECSAGAAEKKPEPLVIKTSASVAPADTDVVVRLRVEPDARSRELTVEWVADDLSGGAHAISLDGERAAAIHQYSIKHMSPGKYVVTAILRFSDGSQIRRAANVIVLGLHGRDLGDNRR